VQVCTSLKTDNHASTPPLGGIILHQMSKYRLLQIDPRDGKTAVKTDLVASSGNSNMALNRCRQISI